MSRNVIAAQLPLPRQGLPNAMGRDLTNVPGDTFLAGH